jgi:beta-lactam-binding protein with PASTA domain
LFEARAELDKWGIRIGKVQFVEGEFANLVEKVYFKNKVLRTGDMVEKFSSVNLVVSKGPGDNAAYISVVNMLVGDAVNALQMQGFAVGQIKYEPNSKEEEGIVFRQDPRYQEGDSLGRGRSITLFVAGEEPEEASEAVE